MGSAIKRIEEVCLPMPEQPRAVAPPAARRSKPPRILLIDPRSLTRECLAYRLQASARDFRIVPVADPAEVVENRSLAGEASLVVYSIGGAQVTQGAVGETIALLQRSLPDTPLVVLSDHDGAEHVAEALRRGARGYVPTSLPLSAAIEAFRFVRAGGTFVPASVITPPASREQPPGSVKPVTASAALSAGRFTARELEVLALLRQGKPNKVIAHELDMQETTVKVHVRHIKNKLGVTNRTEAALLGQHILQSSDEAANSA